MNIYLQESGEKRFMDLIIKNNYKPASDIQEIILGNISAFIENAPVHDDLTMIIMKAV